MSLVDVRTWRSEILVGVLGTQVLWNVTLCWASSCRSFGRSFWCFLDWLWS